MTAPLPSLPAPLFHSAPSPRRKPGRPKGSKAQVIQDARALGIHHFAFVRSSILGLDLAESFDRYLAWGESTTDLRHVQHRRDALLKHIIDAGRHLDASLAPHAKITHLLDLLRSDALAKPAAVLPSLDEWVQSEGMDPDGWSEADLLVEYKAAFGLDNADAIDAAVGLKDPVGERVKALNYLETVLATTASATDRLESWFARPVVKCLRNVGLLTLGDLVRFINVHGYRWHRIQLGAAVVVVPYVLLELAIFPLWKFFGNCAANNAFTSKAQQHLIASAIFFIVFSLIKPFQTTLMWLVETWGTANYSDAWPIRITDTHLLTLFLSVALLGIVSVISEAIKVSQENKEFV
jgi:hypothetical protein